MISQLYSQRLNEVYFRSLPQGGEFHIGTLGKGLIILFHVFLTINEINISKPRILNLQ